MDNLTIYDLNTTEIMNNINHECIPTYVGVLMGVLLFLSEALPFIQAKSKCTEESKACVVDELDVEEETEKKPATLLQQSNGLLHSVVSFYFKMKK